MLTLDIPTDVAMQWAIRSAAQVCQMVNRQTRSSELIWALGLDPPMQSSNILKHFLKLRLTSFIGVRMTSHITVNKKVTLTIFAVVSGADQSPLQSRSARCCGQKERSQTLLSVQIARASKLVCISRPVILAQCTLRAPLGSLRGCNKDA